MLSSPMTAQVKCNIQTHKNLVFQQSADAAALRCGHSGVLSCLVWVGSGAQVQWPQCLLAWSVCRPHSLPGACNSALMHRCAKTCIVAELQ